MPRETQAIRVKNESHPAKVAGAIAHAVRQRSFSPELGLEVWTMGERAAYIALKAMARAQTHLAQERPDLYLGCNVRPDDVEIDGITYSGYVFALGWLSGV